MGLPVNIRPDDAEPEFVYQPPAKYNVGDKVWLCVPAIAWGFPLTFEQDTELEIVDEPFWIESRRGYTQTVEYDGHRYELYEVALSDTPPPEPPKAPEPDDEES